MFETKQTLIVVYRDEMLVNQLKKLVETCDDTEDEVVGTRDDSINIVSWTEKVWLEQKKAGNIQGKILFLGDIKGTDKLIPVIDTAFSRYGATYGWAGNQAVVYAEPGGITDDRDYIAFARELSEMPIPEILKPKDCYTDVVSCERRDDEAHTDSSDDEAHTDSSDDEAHTDSGDNGTTQADVFSEDADNIKADDREKTEHRSKDKRRGILKGIRSIGSDTRNHDGFHIRELADSAFVKSARQAFSSGMDAVGKAGNQIASRTREAFRDKKLMKRQLLFYGVVRFYYDGLEEFMNH